MKLLRRADGGWWLRIGTLTVIKERQKRQRVSRGTKSVPKNRRRVRIEPVR